MLKARRVLAAVLLVAVAVLVWLWLTRPRRVDMAAYVPADPILYAEADSLPEILNALISTDAWRELAPAAGAGADYKRPGWLSGFLSFTGAGPSDAVVLSRAQVAVAVLGFQAAEESDTTLKFTPRAALVAETQTPEWRLKSAVEKLVGDFARRSFGAQTFERKEVDGIPFLTWSEPAGGRKLVAAVEDSVAFVGNDEAAVRACLDVRHGARPSLAGDEQLKEMRARVGGEGALAFGYAPRGSAAKAVEVFAPAFVGGISQQPNIQSVLATVLPQLINQTVGAAGWSARVTQGSVEDRYFLSLPGEMSQRLQTPFAPSAGNRGGAAAVLPAEAFQVTLYDFRSPEEAWRGLGAALSSQVDVSRATLITLALEALLKPYGVEKPREFLRACGNELATARLDAASEGKVLVASVRDRAALREQTLAHLGRGARVERAGDAEILISNDADEGAAAFAGEYLLLGSEEDVRRCVSAYLAGRTLREAPALKETTQEFFDAPAFTRTLTDDRDSARAVLSSFGARAATPALDEALARRGRSVSQTRLTDGGFEKRTRSAFGLFGEIVSRSAPH
ncbi:MAG TPA: hypothetical protein VJ866_14340 [Pyrinomonadaceae bacterium]|nr:hypothetical protein [Pyrinomonadaceae bacterium]